MALVFIEGFDNIALGDYISKGWNQAPTGTAAGRFGGSAMTQGGATTATHHALPSTYATLTVGFAFKATVLTLSDDLMRFRTAALASILTIQFDAGGHILVKNSGGTTIATGTTAVVVNTWYYMEIKLFVNGASGTCEVHLNGATEIASTVGNFGSTNTGDLAFLGLNGTCTFDDVYACDTSGSVNTTFLGDSRVQTIYPTADGAHTAWTPNSGSTHWTQVSETTPDGDTTYVSDLTPNDIDSYVCGDIDTGATVFGVQVDIYARKDDAATRQIAPLIRQASTDYVGTTVTLASTYLFYQQIYNQDPTPANWTAANVNADEFGVKEIA